jgi:hypothetical protein
MFIEENKSPINLPAILILNIRREKFAIECYEKSSKIAKYGFRDKRK